MVSARKPVIRIAGLPDQVLIEVFRHATWVPYGIEFSDLVVKSMQSSRAKQIAKEYRLSLVTKRYLIRVCKKWHRLALLFLYEWILASRADHLSGLLAALELSNGDDSRVGWCTKRLDIDLGHETLTQAVKLKLGDALVSILRALPNLEVLTVANCDDLSWISHSWCSKLMFFNGVHSIKCDGVLDPHVWTSFIESHPRLVGANISTTKLPPSQHTSFTHPLESWTTPEISPVPIDTTFPSLRRLCINLDHYEGPRRYDRLISHPILSLHTLQLNVFKLKNANELNFNLVQSLFQFLPNLRRMDLVLPVWFEHWTGARVPPTVEILGVRVVAHKPKKRDARRFLEALSAHRPPLVQLMDARTMEGIVLHREHLARCDGVLERWLGPDGREYVLR